MEGNVVPKRYIPLCERLAVIHRVELLKSIQQIRDTKTQLLSAGDPETTEEFLLEWDEAIAANKRIDAFRARTPEEIEEYKRKARESVRLSRWELEPERSNAQLIEDGRRTYLAELRLWEQERDAMWN